MFGVSQPSYVDENLTDLPELENEDSERLRGFVVGERFGFVSKKHLYLFMETNWICFRRA